MKENQHKQHRMVGPLFDVLEEVVWHWARQIQECGVELRATEGRARRVPSVLHTNSEAFRFSYYKHCQL